MGIIETVSSSIPLFTAPQLIWGLALGYSVLLLYFSEFEDFWEKIGGSDKGFLGITLGLFGVAIIYGINFLRGFIESTVYREISLMSPLYVIFLTLLTVWPLAAILKLMDHLDTSEKTNPLGVFFLISGSIIAIIGTVYLLGSLLVFQLYLPYNAVLMLHLLIAIGILISVGLVTLTFGWLTIRSLLPPKDWENRVDQVILKVENRFRGLFPYIPDTRTSRWALGLILLLLLSAVYVSVAPKTSLGETRYENYHLTLETGEDGEIEQFQTSAYVNKTVNVVRTNPLGWQSVYFGSINDTPRIYFKNRGNIDYHHLFSVETNRNISSLIIRYNDTASNILKNRTLVLRGRKEVHLSDNISIRSIQHEEKSPLCTTSFVLETDVDREVNVENIAIHRQAFSDYEIENISYRTWWRGRWRNATTYCEGNSCSPDFQGGYLSFIRGSPQGASSDYLEITGGVINKGDFKGEFTVYSTCRQ